MIMKISLLDKSLQFTYIDTMTRTRRPRRLLTRAIMREFKNLAIDLSPEWLTCDGMLSPGQAEAKRQKILAKWAELEAKVGIKVSTKDVWTFPV